MEVQGVYLPPAQELPKLEVLIAAPHHPTWTPVGLHVSDPWTHTWTET